MIRKAEFLAAGEVYKALSKNIPTVNEGTIGSLGFQAEWTLISASVVDSNLILRQSCLYASLTALRTTPKCYKDQLYKWRRGAGAGGGGGEEKKRT